MITILKFLFWTVVALAAWVLQDRSDCDSPETSQPAGTPGQLRTAPKG